VIYLSSGVAQLPGRMRTEAGGGQPPTPVFDALYRTAYLLKPAILAACLIFLPFAWAGPARALHALLLSLTVSQYAVVSLMSQAHQRYSDPVFLLVVMATAIGLNEARRGTLHRATRPGTAGTPPGAVGPPGDP
jgi:hypothetical protein